MAVEARPPRGMLISDGIRAAAGRTPHKVAISCAGQALRYRDLVARIDQVSHVAMGIGLAHGDRAAILAPNRLEYLEIVAGLSAAGIAVATIGPAAPEAEIRFILEDSGARLLFVDPQLEQRARAALPDPGIRVVPIDARYEALLAAASATPFSGPATEYDTFSIPYTSGSTGRPKGVRLSHRGRILSAFCMAGEHGCYSPDDRAVATTPMFHGAGLLMALTPVFFGGSVHLLQRFDIEQLLHAIAEHAATSAYMIPTHFAALFALGAAGERHDLSSMKAVISGTAPLAQAMKADIIARFGEGKLYERYGTTETSIATCLRPADQLRKVACVGQPLSLTRVEVRGADGAVLPPGEVGELAVSSPYLFSGYHNLPEATAASTRDGWFTTGDLGRRDEEGFVYLVDRKNDMIISGGENVYPREVEEVLLAHPGIAECAVVGGPHAYWGEQVTAFVVPRRGAEIAPDALVEFCRAHLPPYKVPKQIRVGDSLPRNSMGKILRRDLRDALRREAAGAA